MKRNASTTSIVQKNRFRNRLHWTGQSDSRPLREMHNLSEEQNWWSLASKCKGWWIFLPHSSHNMPRLHSYHQWRQFRKRWDELRNWPIKGHVAQKTTQTQNLYKFNSRRIFVLFWWEIVGIHAWWRFAFHISRQSHGKRVAYSCVQLATTAATAAKRVQFTQFDAAVDDGVTRNISLTSWITPSVAILDCNTSELLILMIPAIFVSN